MHLLGVCASWLGSPKDSGLEELVSAWKNPHITKSIPTSSCVFWVHCGISRCTVGRLPIHVDIMSAYAFYKVWLPPPTGQIVSLVELALPVAILNGWVGLTAREILLVKMNDSCFPSHQFWMATLLLKWMLVTYSTNQARYKIKTRETYGYNMVRNIWI